MKWKTLIIVFYAVSLSSFAIAQEKVIQLYSGKPAGSENWTWKEAVSDSNLFRTKVVYNVTQPTLTVFVPDPAKANGTAIVIAPGGGFQLLSINSEGNDEAKWLAAHGVTAFVLRYRVTHSVTNNPIQEMMTNLRDHKVMDSISGLIIPLAVTDGLAAMTYVRTHASEYHIQPDKIGFMGFSAGGTVTMGVAYKSNADAKPNFIAPVYAYLPPEFSSMQVRDNMPAFIVAASDDQLGLAPHSVTIYNKWMEAKQSAELHMYAKGGHGFGSRKQNLPTDSWIERFGEWLQLQGLLKGSK